VTSRSECGRHKDRLAALKLSYLIGWRETAPSSYDQTRWGTLDYAENVESQFLSLRQWLLSLTSLSNKRRAKFPNICGLLREHLLTAWTAGSAKIALSAPIFSEALDSANSVRRSDVVENVCIHDSAVPPNFELLSLKRERPKRCFPKGLDNGPEKQPAMSCCNAGSTR
jgi:hypothetical protein